MLSVRSSITIAAFLGILFSHGLTVSLVAPIISMAATEDRGLSTFWVGWIVGSDDIVIFFVSLFAGYFVTLGNSLMYLIGGSFTCAIANFCFAGSNQIQNDTLFMFVCFILRIFQGCGFAFSWSSGLIFMLKQHPNLDAIISSFAEIIVVVGVMLGPTLGNLFYAIFGYSFPFEMTGCLHITFSFIFILAFVPLQIDETEKSAFLNIGTLLWFYFSIPTQLICLQMLAASTFIGFCETILTIHFHDEMNFSVVEVSALWSVIALSYLVMVPIAVYLTDRKCFFMVPIAGTLLSIALYVLFLPYLIPTIPNTYSYESIYLFLSGGSSVSCLIPMYMALTMLAQQMGVSNSSALVSGVINATFAAGGILGPVVFGGIIHEEVGFRLTGGLLGLFVASSTILSTLCLIQRNILVELCCGDTSVDDEYTTLVKSGSCSGVNKTNDENKKS